jgi:uncharacterized membrane protein YcaP (DUF421 family)
MDLVIRATVVFFAIFLVTRVVGRRELGTGEPFDLILLVVLGDLVQQGVTQSDTSLTGTLLVVATFALLTVMLSYLSFRVRPLRKVLAGDPLILVEDGKPIEANLRSQRLAADEILQEARLQLQLTSMDEIRWAILETSGQISIIPRKDG